MKTEEMKQFAFWLNTFFKDVLPPRFFHAKLQEDLADPVLHIRIGDRAAIFNANGVLTATVGTTTKNWKIKKRTEIIKKVEKMEKLENKMSSTKEGKK